MFYLFTLETSRLFVVVVGFFVVFVSFDSKKKYKVKNNGKNIDKYALMWSTWMFASHHRSHLLILFGHCTYVIYQFGVYTIFFRLIVMPTIQYESVRTRTYIYIYIFSYIVYRFAWGTQICEFQYQVCALCSAESYFVYSSTWIPYHCPNSHSDGRKTIQFDKMKFPFEKKRSKIRYTCSTYRLHLV